jgi:Flp pilus assembly pilin Flp
MASNRLQTHYLMGNLRGPVLVLTYLSATLAHLRARLGGPQPREDGVTAVEYALMVAIIALLLVGGFYALFTAVETKYNDVGNCIASEPAPEDCSPPGT